MIFSPLLLPASDSPTPTAPFPLSVNYIAAVVGVARVVCLCVCARMSSGECVAVFSETPAWAYDRTVWLRFTTLLRECEHTHADTHTFSHTNTHKSLLSVSLALCGPCPRSQAAVCTAVPSVASR